MKTQPRAIILLQYLSDKNDFSFSSPLLTNLREHSGQDDVIFSADNFSDQITVHYANSLIDLEQEVLIICDLEGCENPGSNLSILNHAVRKKKNVKLYSRGTPAMLRPFMKFLKGVTFSRDEEVSALLKFGPQNQV